MIERDPPTMRLGRARNPHTPYPPRKQCHAPSRTRLLRTDAQQPDHGRTVSPAQRCLPRTRDYSLAVTSPLHLQFTPRPQAGDFARSLLPSCSKPCPQCSENQPPFPSQRQQPPKPRHTGVTLMSRGEGSTGCGSIAGGAGYGPGGRGGGGFDASG